MGKNVVHKFVSDGAEDITIMTDSGSVVSSIPSGIEMGEAARFDTIQNVADEQSNNNYGTNHGSTSAAGHAGKKAKKIGTHVAMLKREPGETTCLFIFRRDFRLVDNAGLRRALLTYDHVIPIFIFTPEQIEKDQNYFYNAKAIKFMLECLFELDCDLEKHNARLHWFYGIFTLLSQVFLSAV